MKSKFAVCIAVTAFDGKQYAGIDSYICFIIPYFSYIVNKISDI